MKRTLLTLSLLTAVSAAPLALAQSEHKHDHMSTPPAAAEQAVQGKGTLKKIDAAKGVVTMSHEPIAALGWPAMTMDLKVRDKKLLEGFKPGQAVVFDLEKAGEGYVISKLTAAK